MKLSIGFARPGMVIITVLGFCLSVILLQRSLLNLPLGTAYAVWTGIGAIGSLAVGILWFGESLEPTRLASAAFIVAGIVGLSLAK